MNPVKLLARVLAVTLLRHEAVAQQESVLLNNGVRMPKMAFGANIWNKAICKQATLDALQVGFRNIWSSELIGADCQRAQAEAIKASGLARADLFIAGTVNTESCTNEDSCYSDTKRQSEAQFQVLGEETLDMLMLDYPPNSGGCEGILGQWRAFEEFYADGRAKTLAVSNFNDGQLHCILDNASATVPAVNQMLFHVGHGSSTVVEDNIRFGINLQAYTPLAHGRLARDCLECASIGREHGKTVAQVALRWIIQRNATICAQSTKLEHLRADYDIFGFELSDEEMRRLNTVGESRKPRFPSEL